MRISAIVLAFMCSTVAAQKAGNRASFVPPASPRLSSVHAPTAAVASGYGLYKHQETQLFAKKKKKAAVAATKKFQVKMLKHVAGTGQAGEVVMVTPAFFNNKLRPSKSAEIVSDEEVKRERDESQAKTDAINEAAKEIEGELDGFTMVISKKSGPNGQLFGGISPKNLMDELSTQLPKDIWNEKGVKITAVMDEDGKKMKGDIKHVGKFQAQVSLTKKLKGNFDISIEADP